MSNDLEYKGYIGSVEFSAEDMRLFGKVLFIDSLLMYSGESVPELEAAFHETVDAYLEFCAAKGREPNKSYSGSFNIRIGSDLHRKCAVEAHRLGQTLNEFMTRAAATACAREQPVSRVEHVHNHHLTVTLQGSGVAETRLVTPQQPTHWEPMNASAGTH